MTIVKMLQFLEMWKQKWSLFILKGYKGVKCMKKKKKHLQKKPKKRQKKCNLNKV